jgi:hypothetical protein
MYKKVILGICIFAVFALIAIQMRPVQHLLLNNSLIDKIISKFDNYSTLKTSILNHFPGFAYSYVAINVAGSEKNQEKITQKLSLYIHENIFPVGKLYDAAAIEQLTRGVGWCDQMSHLFIRLADTYNIPAHIEFLYNDNGISTHTIATAFLDNKWRAVEPLYNLTFTNNKRATFREICSGDTDVDSEMLNQMDLEWYKPLYCNESRVFMKNEAAGEYSPVIFNAIKNDKNIPVTTVADSWRLIFKLPDFIGSDLFIDLYLITLEDHYPNEDDYLYRSARVLQILGKYNEAINLYNKVIENYPQSIHTKESDFFIGLSRYHSGQYTLSADHFQKIISNNPLSPWVNYSKLYAAKSLIELGKPNDAERLLKSIEGEPSREAGKILYLNNM